MYLVSYGGIFILVNGYPLILMSLGYLCLLHMCANCDFFILGTISFSYKLKHSLHGK